MKTAILVDGGYYRKVALSKFDDKTPEEAATTLVDYCMRHLKQSKKTDIYSDLYRIFYYDCPPSDKKVYHPLLKHTVDLSQTPDSEWMIRFLNALTKKRKVALRLGTLSDSEIVYNLNYNATKKLLSGDKTVETLQKEDFKLTIKQKGVDMKIGVDIASLAYKKQVDQIVLIAGDSDFVPAAKLARREGIDFILDSLARPIKNDLFVHIDGLNFRDSKLKDNHK
ncbi:NYN domain-containing protein [Peptoniphilaceae bacterium SGI.137]